MNTARNTVSRRGFCKTAAAGLAGASAAMHLQAASSAQGGSKPNIIYVQADDLGYGDVGCFGQEKFKTPVIDSMAARGAKFTSHYSGSTVCAPSRCALITGLHTGHTRITGNSSRGLLPEDLSIGEAMKSAGYATCTVGKWSMGATGTSGAPNKKGFDHFLGYDDQTAAHDYYPEYIYRNDRKLVLEGNQNGGQGQYTHDMFTDEVLWFIEQNKDRPFFVYAAYCIPHADVIVPHDDIYREYEALNWPETPYDGTHYVDCEKPNTTRAAMITRMDRDIGRVNALVKQLGLENNTLVIFTSDNGPIGAGGQDPQFFNSSGPLKGLKFGLFEGGIRMPTVAMWPGSIAAGSVIDRPSANWDMMSTFTDIAGIGEIAGSDGISMLPEMLGDSARQREHEYLYWYFRDKRAIRKGSYKLVDDGSPKLYDLSVDIGESDNLASKNPEMLNELMALMDSAHTEEPIVLSGAVGTQPRAFGSTRRRAVSSRRGFFDLLGRRAGPDVVPDMRRRPIDRARWLSPGGR